MSNGSLHTLIWKTVFWFMAMISIQNCILISWCCNMVSFLIILLKWQLWRFFWTPLNKFNSFFSFINSFLTCSWTIPDSKYPNFVSITRQYSPPPLLSSLFLDWLSTFGDFQRYDPCSAALCNSPAQNWFSAVVWAMVRISNESLGIIF